MWVKQLDVLRIVAVLLVLGHHLPRDMVDAAPWPLPCVTIAESPLPVAQRQLRAVAGSTQAARDGCRPRHRCRARGRGVFGARVTRRVPALYSIQCFTGTVK
jgi:hypothetical protein